MRIMDKASMEAAFAAHTFHLIDNTMHVADRGATVAQCGLDVAGVEPYPLGDDDDPGHVDADEWGVCQPCHVIWLPRAARELEL